MRTEPGPNRGEIARAPRTGKTQRSRTVLSASRRTELTAHYPDLLASRIEEYGLQRVHTLVIWTKDPRNLLLHPRLNGVASSVPQVFVHWTVTGLGGSLLEPFVPPAETVLPFLPQLVDWLGGPERLHWRYDPLLEARMGERSIGNLDLELFSALGAVFARQGVATVHTSFVTLYPKVLRRFAAAGLVPSEPSREEQEEFLAQMACCAGALGMQVLTCNQPGFPRRACIDGELLTRLHPLGEPCSTRRARGQRKLCGCTESYDLCHYLRCPNGCLYCYAQPSNPTALEDPAPES